MQVIPSQWGNSLGVRLPKEIVRQAGLEKGRPVEMTVEDGRVIIAVPKRRRRYTIEELLEGMTPELAHQAAQEVDWGPDVGREIVEY